MIRISTIFIVMGVILMLGGLIITMTLDEEIPTTIVDCYDNKNNLMIGVQCIETADNTLTDAEKICIGVAIVGMFTGIAGAFIHILFED